MTKTEACTLPKISARLKFTNIAADILKKTGILSFGLSTEKLLKSAQRKTGLSNFGNGNFEEHLRILLNYFKEDKNLNYTGKQGLQYMVLESLKRRLFLEKDFLAHHEVLEIPVKQPVFIVGFPRTGTTFLQNLMSCHSGSRGLRQWELYVPFPDGQLVWGSDKDPRWTRFKADVEKALKHSTGLDAIHPMDSQEETWTLLWLTFVCHAVFLYFGLDKYHEWIKNTSENAWKEAYQVMKRQLQYLSWRQPGCHWVVKSPEHMVGLVELLEVFPDARILQLHRGPKEFIASLCSLTYYCQSATRKDCKPEKIGRQVLAILSEWGRKNVSIRKKLDHKRFCDIHYQELVNKPMETVCRIYDHFGMKFPDDMQSKLNKWIDKKHGGNRQQHRYSLEQFGLCPEDITYEFEDYCKYFQIKSE